MMRGHLRFAPDILSRLGEELIPNPEQGIVEMVKNAYDADATLCTVSLLNITHSGGSILIIDNGDGMNVQDIFEGFFMIGKSRKSPNRRSTRKRLPVGDKGLGRLAALRLGSKAIVRSRPKAEPGIEYKTEFDWLEFNSAASVEDVDLLVTTERTSKPNGVTIEISNISNGFSKPDIKRLARELVLLSDPFDTTGSFRVELVSPEFQELEKRVQRAYFDDADFKLTAQLYDDGTGKTTLENSLGVVLDETVLPVAQSATKRSTEQETYQAPKATFELWVFLLGANFSTKNASIAEVRDWLSAVGGVHIYHRGIRVRPYGDPGSDWLDMNLRRARHPEERPSTNTVIGRVMVEDPDLILEQPTNRIGFIQSEAFEEVRRFASDALDWMGEVRLRNAETRRREEKAKATINSQKALEEVRAVIKRTVPPQARKSVEQAVTNFVTVKENESISLREDLQLYRSLATAGTTSAVFAHESGKPISRIRSLADTLEKRGQKHLGEAYDREFEEPISNLRGIHESLSAYSKFPIHHLKSIKRRAGRVDLLGVWAEIVTLFQPMLEKAHVEIVMDYGENTPQVRGSVALIEAIATNLMTNSVRALTRSEARLDGRCISISHRVTDRWIIVVHADNGPGIEDIDPDDIWLPGKSAYGGTGLGLTIVKDCVTDLGGRIETLPHGHLGGAEFRVALPLLEGNHDIHNSK